jgi:hypothetical protein
MENKIDITEIKEPLNKNIIKAIIKYKKTIYKDDKGYFLCLDDTGLKTYITGKFKCKDFNVMYNLIPWKKNHKTIEENKKRWNDYYKKIKELESTGIINKLNDDDYISKEAERQNQITEKLKKELIHFDDFFIEGEKSFYSYNAALKETDRRLTNE